MRSFKESRTRWEATFATIVNISELRAAVRKDAEESPCQMGLRSVCWKAFLLFENLDRSTWPKTIYNSRSAYRSLKEHLLRDLENSDDLAAVDPLADDDNSIWNTLRRDELLRAEILQDVQRCMPENLYFREPTTQAMLLDILFIFCKLNADIGYRQGMHEILAPMLWVVSRDAIDPETLSGPPDVRPGAEELLLSTLDARFIEHDSFSIFCIVMQTAKSFYEMASNVQPTNGSVSGNSAIIDRSRRIHEDYLRRTDPELAEHLTSIDILPQIFVIRWIRLLFGREFPFEDVLSLWDVIFAEDPCLDLVDYVCLAMLLRVRWQLLEADYSSALTLLLRYPVPQQPHGPTTFVDDALYLKGNLNSRDGALLVKKYSGRVPAERETSASALGHKRGGIHTPRGGSVDLGTTVSPLRSPAKFLQDQGGIENIIQEAARGVYSRSEKWGLNKALRGAVQGLQPGSGLGIRLPSDEGRAINGIENQLGARILALESRNKLLAKMLQGAIEDLSAQSKAFEQEKADAAANALTLAIAKLQYLQVYLEDSTLPLDQEQQVQTTEETPSQPDVSADTAHADERSPTRSYRSLQQGLPLAPKDSGSRPESRTAAQPPVTGNPPPSRFSNPLSLPSPFQHSRPSLAQSSFSWMLGGGRSKSGFVSASPFSPGHERKNATRGKTAFLFGDDGRHLAPGGGAPRAREGDVEDDEGFTLGTLRGVGMQSG